MSRCRPFFLVLWSLLLLAPHAHGALGLHLQEVKPDVPARTELVVGVPRDGYPPFLFKMPTRGYSGPLKNVAARIAAEMGLSLRYVSYRTYREAGQALQKGEIDALVGVERAKLAQNKIDYIGHLGSYPRAILMANPDPNLSLARAKTLRWVCIQGFGSCQELARLGMTKVTEVVSRDEATNMVKSGAADAYLGLGPVVAKEMQSMSATMGVVRPSWVAGSALTIAIAKGDPQLTERFLQAYQRIPIRDLRLRLSADASHFKPGLLLDPDETAWLTQHNHVIKFAVAPSFGGISEIDEEGELQGYAADLITLLTANSGIRFELVPTRQWHESIELLKQQQVDLIPLMTALASRRDFASFTSPFLRINSYVVARQGTPPLSSLTALQGRRIVGVTDSHEASLIARYGAEIVEVDSDSDLLAALDSGLADYALLTMTSLGQQAIQGFSNKYQVVFSSPQLALPVSMGITSQQPELTRIMNKLLQSITDEEWRVLEQRWLNVSVNQGPDYGVMFRGLAIGGGLLLCGGLLVLAWNWSLRRQINQRKMAERLLNEQLQFVETLLESLPSMVALLDRDQRFIQCNQAYRDTFMGQENIHALDQLPFMTRAVKDMVLAEERTIWQTGQGMQGAGMAVGADGSLLHVAYAKRPYHDPDGNMRGVLTVLTDVTHIKEAEARARHAETRLAQITDSMPGIVFQYVWQDEGKGRFLYISEGVESILGINREQVFATTSAGELLAASPAVCQALIKQVAHHARTLTPVDLELISKNGPEERILQLRGNFQLGEKGALLLNGVIQDITSLKRQQNELQEARASAEQAMQARSRFLANMSHELRTPISGMHGMLELLQMSQLNDDQHDMVRNVVSSTHNLLYLVNDILDFSKIEAGQLQLHYQTRRLQTVICDAIRGHATLAHGRGLKVTLVWGPLMPDHADIDAVRIGQVISNLLSNAVKFTTKGEIRILVNYQHGQLAISVSDTGIGIAQEKQRLLFTPFEQVESDINRRFGGSGLGLAICRQLVQKMSGELSVTSKIGEGACFHFTVPLLQPLWDKPPLTGTEWWFCSADSHLEAAMVRLGATLRHLDVSQLHRAQQGLLLADQSCLEQALGREWQQWLKHGALKGIITSSNEALRGRVEGEPWWRLGLSPLYPDLLLESCQQLLQERVTPTIAVLGTKLTGKVLVADDHPVNRALLTKQLASLGIEAEVVEDGEQALQRWRMQPFSLLLTDCHMPVMDGYTLTQALREQGVTTPIIGVTTPIIGVTADTSEEASVRMVAAGMDDMLFKPYPLDSLRQLLSHWLPELAALEQPAALLGGDRGEQQAAHWRALFGDEQTAREMAAHYLESNDQDGKNMMAALACLDTQSLQDTAHRIKGAARMVGLEDLAAQAASLESAARLQQVDKLAELAGGVQVLITAIAKDIGLWVNE